MSYIGTYDGTIYHNPANQYCVISVKSSDTGIPGGYRSPVRKKDHLIRFTAVGYSLPLTDAVQVELDGEWVNGKYGYQLHVTECRELIPETEDGIQGYLASGLIKGIGPRLAEDIVQKFGKDSLSVLEKEPERYLEIRGISENKLEEIRQSYLESHALKDIMILLSPFKVSPKTALKIYQELGPTGAELLRKSPYELCRLPGFGFRRVDLIARKTNKNLHDPLRIKGAILCALSDAAAQKGHLFLPKAEILKQSLSFLNASIPLPAMRITSEEAEKTLSDMILHGSVVSATDHIYLPKFFSQEDEAARCIAKLIRHRPPKINISVQLQKIISESGLALSKEQQLAVETAFQTNLSIITGSPGTGKTTVLKIILTIIQTLYPKAKVIMMAPTGRASRNMAESTGFPNARTMHSVLHLYSSEDDLPNDSDGYLDAAMVIVDECSMVDMWLAWKFFPRIRPGTKLILVGDPDQLPSVGPGAVFRELIQCGLIPVTRLVQIFRQAEGSIIPYNAALINQGNTRLTFGNDFQFLTAADQAEAAEKIRRLYCQEVEKYGMEQVQILAPFRSSGEASANELNLAIQETVNPFQRTEDEIHLGQKIFRVHDRIMQTKNTDDVSNGDLGFLESVEDTGSEKKAHLTFNGLKLTYSMEALANVDLAYATTIHKFMGSQTQIVLIPVLMSQYNMLYRNLIYTAVTRAKEKVILVGEKRALFMAIHRADTSKRNTMLGERIQLYAKAYAKAAELFPEELKDAV